MGDQIVWSLSGRVLPQVTRRSMTAAEKPPLAERKTLNRQRMSAARKSGLAMSGMERKNYRPVCAFNLEKQGPVEDRFRCGLADYFTAACDRNGSELVK